jgi:MFS superfamily sulfate permease-like transporter
MVAAPLVAPPLGGERRGPASTMADQSTLAGRLFASLRGYDASWLPGDAIAAVTLAAIAIPEQLATARLVGVPPQAGLLAFAAGSIAFAAFGANRFMSVGADSTIAPIMAGGLAALAAGGSASYVGLAATLALLVGIALLLAHPLRLGWVADLLSVPVTTGFLAGVAIHIIVGQLPALLGIAAEQGSLIAQLAAIMRQLPQASAVTVAIGLGVLAMIAVAEHLSARIPGPLIGLAASGIVVWLLALQNHDVAVLGALPIEAPVVKLAMPTWQQFTRLVPLSLIIALICVMQTAAVVRSFPSDAGGQEDVSRDFAAVGVGSMLAGLLGAFAVNASPPRTAVVHESGGRSQLSAVLAVAIAAAIVLVAARAFAFVPVAALAGVLIFIALRIVRVATMRQIMRNGGGEIWLVAASAALIVLLPIQIGVTMSIVMSLLHGIYIVARPDCAVLARVAGTTVWWALPMGEIGQHEPGVLVFAPGAPIQFTNATYVRGKLMDAVRGMGEPCRLVVIEGNGVIDIDFSGSQVLQKIITDLRQRNIDVAVARLASERAQGAAVQTGLFAVLGNDHVFRSVEDAIQALRALRSPTTN